MVFVCIENLIMSNAYFSFKQFTVYHDRCAMKVGTDGVLLGAWADVSDSKHILDVGTGTGLISLMLAQRSDALITAIDIDESAINQAKDNVLVSPWKDRISVKKIDVNEYVESHAFDVIVSNPPYFIDSLKCVNEQRNKARHTDTLSAVQLVGKVADLLSSNGRFSLIIPFEQSADIIRMAEEVGMYPSRHTAVITRPGLLPKRSLLEFRKDKCVCQSTELIIELDRHVYTDEYIALTKDFYLKM